MKKTLGIEREPPDEFAVTPSSQPLDMPPDFFVLPPPAPGTPRPQDIKAEEEKKEKILGSTLHKGPISPGQKALLEAAGAEDNQDNIRYQIDQESRIESAKNKPILEKLGIKKPSRKEEIDPYQEALELQKKGISQTPSITSQ